MFISPHYPQLSLKLLTLPLRESFTEGPRSHYAYNTTTKIHPHTTPFSPTPRYGRGLTPAKTRNCRRHPLTNSFPLLPLPCVTNSNSPQSKFDFAKHSIPEASILDRRETDP
ncbi:hypothetical protein ACSQ67_014165 [Phaseolus vulgaris]